MKAEAFILKIPMKEEFKHDVLNRKASEGVILKLQYKNLIGIGECAPRKYVTGECCDTVIESISNIDLNKIISNIDFSCIKSAISSYKELNLGQLLKNNLNALCLIETAILDLIGNYFKCTIKDIITKYLFNSYDNGNKSMVKNTSQVFDLSMTSEKFIKTRGPFSFVKIKMTNSIETNRSLVSSIRKSLGEDIPISVDANMAWSLSEAKKMIKALEEFNIAYFEEPLHKKQWKDYGELRQTTNAKIMLDESACTFDDIKNALIYKSCDAINVRIAKNGGILNAVKIINICRENNLAYQIGAQVAEMGPLIAAGRHLAFSVDDFITYEAGQPDRFFEEYIINPMPLVDRDTNLAYQLTGNGLGIKLLDRFQNYVTKSTNFIL